jgi:hypothetical protein
MDMEINSKVKVLGEKPGSINEYARINSITERGNIWVTNLNMPFMGTISELVTPEVFKEKYEVV